MIEGLLVCLQFFTRLPINRSLDYNRKSLSFALGYLPLVGILLASLAYFMGYLFSYINQELASLVIVFSLVILTGGLHLDGLADTVDGFFSCRERAEVLEIMEDSRIGAFGVIGLVFTLLFKYILVKNMEGNFFYVLLLSLGNSRLVLAYVLTFKATAKDRGMGKYFKENVDRKAFYLSSLVYLIFILYLDYTFLVPLGATFFYSYLVSRWAYKKIGGYTGDVYGFLIETGELVSMIAFMGVKICG